ncbi:MULTISPECIES: ECF transporter S component [Clostridium]|uniref:ECF transporter S component n=1 Tax=Clostridium cibarium TaxID=2762247 RepID=A0ABR8PP38_9CLOT|nr:MULTISPECIES: ECF transporter S component [Clostridium]MBD7909943.1 ECF transporter S component [Clostridium cibarium]
MNSRTKEMIYAALLTALAIIIPVQFSFLRVIIPPFSATVASHVPMFIAMLVSPMVAVVVGVGSVVGFLFTGLPMPIVFRAAIHILVGLVGAIIIKRSRSYVKASIFTAPIHGIGEALVVIPFVGFNVYQLLVVVCVGTIIHHAVDSTIAYAIVKAIAKARRKSIYNTFNEVITKQLT